MRSVAALILASCTFTTSSAPRELRYFAPEVSPRVPGVIAVAGPPCRRVRLGRTSTASDLGLPIVRRVSSAEVQPYETLRWTEAPDIYVRRALVHALFDAGSLEQAIEGDLVLDVAVLGFEQSGRPGAASGRVELEFELRDDHRVFARGDANAERPATDTSIEAVVAATSEALAAAADEVARRVAAEACTPLH